MTEPGQNDITFEHVKKEWKERRRKEREAKEQEPVFLDHVRTSSGVRFRKYYVMGGQKHD